MEAILKREILFDRTLCRVFGVTVFIILTALGAFVRIPLPFTPVPITLQTLFVLLSAVALGSNLGGLTQVIYIILGVSGLPIFAGAGNGIYYLFGPTGGYLFGFVAAVFFAGNAVKSVRPGFFPVFLILFVTSLIILGFGSLWLKLFFGYTFTKSLFLGLVPFLPGDLLKSLIAAALYLKLKPRLEEIF